MENYHEIPPQAGKDEIGKNSEASNQHSREIEEQAKQDFRSAAALIEQAAKLTGGDVPVPTEATFQIPEIELDPGQRFASPEERDHFWIVGRRGRAEKAIDAIRCFGRQFGNDQLDEWTMDDIRLVVDPQEKSAGGLYYWDTTEVAIYLPGAPRADGSIENYSSALDGREFTRMVLHEAGHKLITTEFRDAQIAYAHEARNGDIHPADVFQIIEEALASESTQRELEDIEPGAQSVHTRAYLKAWVVFETVCEKIADRVDRYQGNESEVMRSFDDWAFKPGAAPEMMKTINATFGDRSGELVDLLSGYSGGVLDRDLTVPENEEKYTKLMEFLDEF